MFGQKFGLTQRDAVMNKSFFNEKGSFCNQIDGVAMGSPLASVLPNLFMGHHENFWLENWQGSEVLFYYSREKPFSYE